MTTKPKPKPRSTKRQPTNEKPPAGQRGELLRIGALWLGTSQRTGVKFMSGRIEINEGQEPLRILVFKNGYKENASHPDYIIYEPSNPQEQRDRAKQAKGRGKADYDDSDIPF